MREQSCLENVFVPIHRRGINHTSLCRTGSSALMPCTALREVPFGKYRLAGPAQVRTCGRAAQCSHLQRTYGSQPAAPAHQRRASNVGMFRVTHEVHAVAARTLRLKARRPPEGRRTLAVTNFRKSLRADAPMLTTSSSSHWYGGSVLV